jgi:hypothetical protein
MAANKMAARGVRAAGLFGKWWDEPGWTQKSAAGTIPAALFDYGKSYT